jgi:hypothetical protein
MQREVVAKLEETAGKEREEVGTALARLAETLRRRGSFVEAAACARRSLAIETKIGGPERLAVAFSNFQLGAALACLPDEASRREADELLERSAALYRKLKPDHPRLPDVLRARERLAAAAPTGSTR